MITPEEFYEKMLEYSKVYDVGTSHSCADDLMCEVLEQLGYGKGIEVYDEMEKWYE